MVDLFATLADFLGMDYGSDAAEDSFSFWPQIIEGPEAPASRDHVIVQSPLGVRAIVRDGWKYIRKWEPPENLSKASRETMSRELLNPENLTQLYHLNADPGESVDQLTEFPAVVRQL